MCDSRLQQWPGALDSTILRGRRGGVNTRSNLVPDMPHPLEDPWEQVSLSLYFVLSLYFALLCLVAALCCGTWRCSGLVHYVFVPLTNTLAVSLRVHTVIAHHDTWIYVELEVDRHTDIYV